MRFSPYILLATLWQSVSVIADDNACSGKSSVTISSQSDANNLTNCDTLQGSVTISSSASGTITLSNVEEIKGALSVESGSSVENLVFPKLETLDSGLTLDSLDSLSSVSFSTLSKSSRISITGNPNLKHLNFPELEEVDGELRLTGSFETISMSSLDQVRGQTTIRGASSLSCSALDALRSEGVYRGSYSCSGGSSGGGLSAGAKAGITIGVIVVVVLILVLVWFFIRRRRQQKARKTRSLSPESSSPDIEESKPPQVQEQVLPVRELKPPLPRKPVGPQAAQLDGNSIYEVSSPMSPATVYHEMDAGPVVGSHQRPINSEASS